MNLIYHHKNNNYYNLVIKIKCTWSIPSLHIYFQHSISIWFIFTQTEVFIIHVEFILSVKIQTSEKNSCPLSSTNTKQKKYFKEPALHKQGDHLCRSIAGTWSFWNTNPPNIAPVYNLWLKNHLANFKQTWHRLSLGRGCSNMLKWRVTSSFKGGW